MEMPPFLPGMITDENRWDEKAFITQILIPCVQFNQYVRMMSVMEMFRQSSTVFSSQYDRAESAPVGSEADDIRHFI